MLIKKTNERTNNNKPGRRYYNFVITSWIMYEYEICLRVKKHYAKRNDNVT